MTGLQLSLNIGHLKKKNEIDNKAKPCLITIKMKKNEPLLGGNYAHFCVYIETINVNGESWILLSFKRDDMNTEVILVSIER